MLNCKVWLWLARLVGIAAVVKTLQGDPAWTAFFLCWLCYGCSAYARRAA